MGHFHVLISCIFTMGDHAHLDVSTRVEIILSFVIFLKQAQRQVLKCCSHSHRSQTALILHDTDQSYGAQTVIKSGRLCGAVPLITTVPEPLIFGASRGAFPCHIEKNYRALLKNCSMANGNAGRGGGSMKLVPLRTI